MRYVTPFAVQIFFWKKESALCNFQVCEHSFQKKLCNLAYLRQKINILCEKSAKN